MEILTIYLAITLVLTAIASSKGNGIPVFFCSLMLSPLFGLLMILLMSDKTRIKCPQCDELISHKANVCKHCGFSPRGE